MAQLMRALLCVLLLLAAGAVGCGGSGAGRVPVDSPIMEFQPPDPEELVGDEEDDWDDEEAEEESGEGAGEPADGADEPGDE